MHDSFWHGKKVLLTGHTGFKGSWLVLWLQRLGAQVIGLALPPASRPNLFEAAGVGREMTSLIGDITDLSLLRSIVNEHRPQIVIHMAAQPLVRLSYADPVGTFATNVMGTVHMLEAVRHCPGVRVVVIVTTDKCYQNREWIWGYRENEALGGHDPYSASKACAEIVTAAYRDSFFKAASTTAVATVRAGNVIGGGDWSPDRLVPDVLAAFAEGRPAILRNPTAIRPWQHVLEPLGGYLLLAQKLWENGPELAGAYNFGPSDADALPVVQVVERLADLWGNGASWEQDADAHPHEAHLLRLDCSKSRARLGYTPRLTLQEALMWIVDWHRQWLTGGDVRKATEAQIEQFVRLRQTTPPDIASRPIPSRGAAVAD